jgi:hypothetical protein
MSSRRNKRHSGKDDKEEKQQDGPIRQLLLQACNERGSDLLDKAHARDVDAGTQQIKRSAHATVVLR